MADNETFQAKVIAALSTPGGAEAIKVFEDLDAAVKIMEGDAKAAATRVAGLVKEFRDGKGTIEGFKTELQGMGEFLKTLSTAQKTIKLFEPQDIQNILSAAKAIRQASDAMLALKKDASISKGNFGLDSQSIKETNTALKALQQNLNAVTLAVQKKPSDTGLYLQKVQIEANVEAVKKLRDSFNLTKSAFDNVAANIAEQGKVELTAAQKKNKALVDEEKRAQAERIRARRQDAIAAFAEQDKADKALRAQIKQGLDQSLKVFATFEAEQLRLAQQANKQRNTEAKRAADQNLAEKRREIKETLAEQAKLDAFNAKRLDARVRVGDVRKDFYQTNAGASVAFGKYDIEQARNGLFNAPGYMSSRTAGIQRQDDSRYLKDAFASANIANKSSAALLTDSQIVKNSLAEIVRLEKQIVDMRRAGKNVAEEELKIFNRIGEIRKGVSLQRQSDRANDPALNAADRGRQTQNMLDRITGESGGALLAVQASLMANYSILTGIVNGVQQAIVYSVNLEAAFKNIQAVTDTTGIEMVGLEKAIKNVAGSTKFNAKEVSDAALILGQAGLTAKQVAESIQPVVMLATASGASLEQAVDIVTSVVGVFNVTTSETADVANKITQSVNVSKLSIDKLALGFQYAGNTASQLGVSFEEVTAAMAAMSNAGIKSGSTMGTGLRQLLIELQNPTEEFVQTLHGVGLTITDLDLRTQSFSEVLRKLRDAGFVASDAIKSFDVRGAAAFNALIANPDQMDDIIRQLNESQAAVKANDVQMESLKNQSLRLTSAMGNLVSTALTPTQQSLAVLVGGLADGIQAVSNMSGAVEILGTVLAGALGAATASLISTTLGSLVAIAPRLIAMGAAAPALAAVGSGIMAISAAATTATGALGALSLLLSPTGIGIALAAATGLYFALNGAIETSAERTEKETAALNLAKGALDEKSQAVESLDKKITELSAKTDFLRGNQQALSVEISSLVSKFGQFGFSMVGASGDIDVILGRLRDLRGELAQLQGIEMQNVAARASSLANEKESQARDTARSYSTGFFKRGAEATQALTGSRRQDLVGLLKDEGGASSRAFQLLDNYSKQLAAGKPANEIGELATVSATLNRLVSTLEGQRASGTFKGTEEFANVLRFAAESTRNVSETSSSARVARQEADVANRSAVNQSAFESFNKSNNVESSLRTITPNISQLAKSQLGDKPSPTELYRRGVLLYNDSMKKLETYGEELNKKLEKAKVDPAVATQVRQQVTNAEAELRRELAQLQKGADPYLKLEDKDNQRSYEAQARMLKTKQRGGKDVMQERIDLERKRGEELIEERLRALTNKTGPEAENIRKEIGQQVEFRIQDIQEQAAQVGGKAATGMLSLVGASLQRQADVAMKAAKVERNSVKPQDGFDDINTAMNNGLGKIAEAKALELKSVAEKIRAGSATESDLQTVKEKYALATEDFINSFRDMYSSAAKRLYDLKDTIKKAQNDLNQLKLDADTRAFERGNTGRELDLQSATSGEVGLARARREAANAGATSGLADTRGQQALVANLLVGVNQQLSDLKSSRLGNEESFGKYKNLSASGIDSLGKDEKQEMWRLESEIREQTELINKLESLGIQYQKEKRDLVKDEYEYRLKIIQTQDRGPKTVGPDAVIGGAKRGFDDYKEKLKGMDPEQMIGQGIFDTLNKAQDSFGALFMDVMDGSKSAGDAFQEFAVSVIKSLLQIAAQQAALAIFQQVFGAFMGGAGAGAGAGGTTVNGSAGTGMGATYARHGGSVYPSGKVQTFAQGGPVTGGVPGRDSVPALVMPGEFVLKSSAVDAVGTDFLHSLNNAGNNVVSSSAPKEGAAMGQGGGVVNVWVVSPDQQPVPGPRDVIAAVTDDIQRGGTVKQLIKQVAMGQA